MPKRASVFRGRSDRRSREAPPDGSGPGGRGFHRPVHERRAGQRREDAAGRARRAHREDGGGVARVPLWIAATARLAGRSATPADELRGARAGRSHGREKAIGVGYGEGRVTRDNDAPPVRQLSGVRKEAARVLDIHRRAGLVRFADEPSVFLRPAGKAAPLGARTPGHDHRTRIELRSRAGGIGSAARSSRISMAAARSGTRRQAARVGQVARRERRDVSRKRQDPLVQNKTPEPSGPGGCILSSRIRPARTNSAGRKAALPGLPPPPPDSRRGRAQSLRRERIRRRGGCQGGSGRRSGRRRRGAPEGQRKHRNRRPGRRECRQNGFPLPGSPNDRYRRTTGIRSR